MSESDLTAWWVQLTVHVLSQPIGQDPMAGICDEVASRYDATACGMLDVGDGRARVGAHHAGADLRPYESCALGHPLVRYYRSTGDPRVRRLADAAQYSTSPSARSALDALAGVGLVDFVFVPLRPRPPMTHRWLCVCADRVLPRTASTELEHLRPLLEALDAHFGALTATRMLDADREPSGESPLTSREVGVLQQIARGDTAAAIAYRLGITPRTVSKHQQHIYRKLDVSDRLSAVLRAQQLGILPARRGARERVSAGAVDRELVLQPL